MVGDVRSTELSSSEGSCSSPVDGAVAKLDLVSMRSIRQQRSMSELRRASPEAERGDGRKDN